MYYKRGRYEDSDWKCIKCKTNNFGSRTICFGCKIPKSRPGDWICGVCGELQFSSRDACRKCKITHDGKIQDSTFRPKPDDWICPNDNEINFKSRTSCRKCGRSKTEVINVTNDSKYVSTSTKSSTCIVCMDTEISHVIITCGHMCLCYICGLNLDKCPICRTEYSEEQLIKVYT